MALDSTEATGEDRAASESVAGPQLDAAIDPMGLGGVGGGLFGGDPAGTGGSLLTGGPDTTAQEDQAFWDRTKNFRQAHNVHTFDFWSPVLKSITKGRKDLTALGLKFDKNNKVTPRSLLSFMQDQDKATKNLTNVIENLLKDYEDWTAEEKSIVVDALIHSMVNAWDGINVKGYPHKTKFVGTVNVDVNFSHELNKAVRDAVLGKKGLFGSTKGWKDQQGLPRTHETFDVFGITEDDKDKTPDVRVDKSYQSIMGIKENKKDLDVDAKINNYLGKKTNLNTIMAKVEARQNKGRVFGDHHNIGYRGPTKSITTPLGSGKSFTQVQANVPTSQWSAVQQGKVGPIQGMIGVKGKGLDPNSLAPVGDISLNPAQSLSFSPFSAVHGKIGYNTDKGVYGGAGVTASGKAFGGTWGANIGWDSDQGPVAGVNFNYNW